MKSIRQTRGSGGGRPRPSQGNWINSDGPDYVRIPVQTGYQGGMTDSADNYFGGTAGMGRLFPEDFFEEEEPVDDLQEFLNKMINISMCEALDIIDEDPEEDNSKDEEDIEEISAGGVAGVAVPIGRNPDGSKTTRNRIKKFRKFSKRWY